MNNAQALQLPALPTAQCAEPQWNARSLQSRDNPRIELFPSEQTLPAASDPDARPCSHDDFLTLRNLAADLYELFAKLRKNFAGLKSDTAFQIPRRPLSRRRLMIASAIQL